MKARRFDIGRSIPIEKTGLSAAYAVRLRYQRDIYRFNNESRSMSAWPGALT